VGVGRGPQDLANFAMYLAPEDRRNVEEEALDAYYEALIEASRGGVDQETFTKEACKSEYVQGGVCRWIWMLAHFGNSFPEYKVKYFHDQLLEFVIDHDVKVDDVQQPRP